MVTTATARSRQSSGDEAAQARGSLQATLFERKVGKGVKAPRPLTLAGRLAAILLVAFGSWVLLTRGVALALAKASPVLALKFNGADAEALLRLNESETNAVVKARRARLVLAQRPLDGRAYRQLAEAEKASGRPQTAARLLRVALRDTPRDRLAQAWMIDQAVARGHSSEAMARLILLVDMDATLWQVLFPYLRSVSADEAAWKLLVARMSTAPSWRGQLLAEWERDAPKGFDTLMLALEARRARLTAAERELWVQHLVRIQRWDAAYLAWTAGLRLDRRPGAVGLSNGGFERMPAGFFDWHVALGGGNRMDLLETAGASGERAMRLQFTAEPGAGSEQVLVLLPGDYAFVARARMEDRLDERGLVWSVRCVDGQRLLGVGPTLHRASQWYSYTFRFHVPSNCPAQRVAVEDRFGGTMAARPAGVAWFDDVAIVESLPVRGDRNATAGRSLQPMQEDGMPAALVRRAAGTTIVRGGLAMPANAGTLLLEGDRIVAVPPHRAIVRWRDGCEREVTSANIALASPCPRVAPSSPVPLLPQAMKLVRASLSAHPGEWGNRGGDVPVGP